MWHHVRGDNVDGEDYQIVVRCPNIIFAGVVVVVVKDEHVSHSEIMLSSPSHRVRNKLNQNCKCDESSPLHFLHVDIACVFLVRARPHTCIGVCRLSASQSTRTIRAAAGRGGANVGATPGTHIIGP